MKSLDINFEDAWMADPLFYDIDAEMDKAITSSIGDPDYNKISKLIRVDLSISTRVVPNRFDSKMREIIQNNKENPDEV